MHESIKVRKIGKYILQRQIGQGSMGTIWLSHHMGLDIPVAVKILKSSLIEVAPEYIERFIQEGNVAGTIHHKNIIRIYDAGHQGNIYYMVMEYVDGGNAQEMIENRGCLTPDEVLEFGIVISDALIEAHAHNVIHRDIKPENIMITKEGRIKVADLGLAKQIGDGYSSTMAGAAVGTPNYISPEQVRGSQIADHRCDIYSLGATLYHMLTGKLPFVGDSNYEVMRMHCEDELTPPQELQEGLPLPLCKAICKMMAKNPDKRYQSCEEINEILNKYKYSSEHKHVATGKTQVILEKLDVDELQKKRRKAKEKREKEQAAKRKKLSYISSAILAVILVLIIILRSNRQKENTLQTKQIVKNAPETIKKPEAVKKEELKIFKEDESIKSSEKPPKQQLSQSEKSSDGSTALNPSDFKENPIYTPLNSQLRIKDPAQKFFTITNKGMIIKKNNGRKHTFAGSTEKYKNFNLYMVYRWLEDKGSIKICLFRRESKAIDLHLRKNIHPKSGSLEFKNHDYLEFSGLYQVGPREGTKVLNHNTNVEKELGEWNTAFILKKNDTLTVFVNKIEIGTVKVDMEKSYIGLNLWRDVNIEFKTFAIQEIK